MPSRTIDNLGMDVSTRYAEDQKILDKSLIKESSSIPVQTEIDVTIPFHPSEMEALLQSARLQKSWASFIAPALYFEQKKRFFTFQLIPSLGSEDKQESQASKILARLQKEEEESKEQMQQDTGEEKKKKKNRQQLVLEEEEKEKKIIITLLQTISAMDKLLIEINAKRRQYQKG